MLALCPHDGLADQNITACQCLVRTEAQVDLLRDGHVEGIALDGSAMRPRLRFHRSKSTRMQACRSAREGARSERGLTGTLGAQPPTTGKSPGASDEHADADPFALGIPDALDPPVLRRHELVALEDDPSIRVLRASTGRRVDRSCAELSH